MPSTVFLDFLRWTCWISMWLWIITSNWISKALSDSMRDVSKYTQWMFLSDNSFTFVTVSLFLPKPNIACKEIEKKTGPLFLFSNYWFHVITTAFVRLQLLLLSVSTQDRWNSWSVWEMRKWFRFVPESPSIFSQLPYLVAASKTKNNLFMVNKLPSKLEEGYTD